MNLIIGLLIIIIIALIGIICVINDVPRQLAKKRDPRPELSLPTGQRANPILHFDQQSMHPSSIISYKLSPSPRVDYISYSEYMRQNPRKTPNQIRIDWGYPPLACPFGLVQPAARRIDDDMKVKEIKPASVTHDELLSMRKDLEFNRIICERRPMFIDSADLYSIVGKLTDHVDLLSRVITKQAAADQTVSMREHPLSPSIEMSHKCQFFIKEN